VVEGVRGKEVGPDAPLLMATYTEAANKFTKAAMEIMEYAHRLTGARNACLLRQKECELVRLRREIDSLKIVIPLLVEDALETKMAEQRSPQLADIDLREGVPMPELVGRNASES
jgi:hypothetical protein